MIRALHSHLSTTGTGVQAQRTKLRSVSRWGPAQIEDYNLADSRHRYPRSRITHGQGHHKTRRLRDRILEYGELKTSFDSQWIQGPGTIPFLTSIEHRLRQRQAVIDVPHKWTINTAANSSCLVTDRSSNPTPPPPPPYVRYMLNELQLSSGELIYGLGEQFGPLIKNGQVSASSID